MVPPHEGGGRVLAARLWRLSEERRVIAWNSHVERHQEIWSYRLLSDKDGSWFRARKLQWATGGRHTELSGRTRTWVAGGGCLQKR